jgi:hypothetical protein
MSLKNSLLLLSIGALFVWGALAFNSPYRTRLPFGSKDLGSVQAQLDKLPEEDRMLVIGYVKRSNGDYLPARFADPDAPFTASNFKEAIALQKNFLASMSEQGRRAQALKLERDAKYAPLREALSVKMLKREILPRDQAAGIPKQSYFIDGQYVMKYANEAPVQVTTYRIKNNTHAKMEAIKAMITVRKLHPSVSELGILGDCYIEHSDGIDARSYTDIACADAFREAGKTEREYVAMPDNQFYIDWEPKRIRFSNGQVLEYKD